MIDLLPFRGVRYDPAVVGDVGRVVAPPYDVIAEDERERLQQSHPQNIVRLILGQAQPGDGPADNVYSRAAATFADWRARHVLRRDEQPAMYLYEQTFSLDERQYRRLGFIARLSLDERVEDGVFRHEQTFQGPKTDREHLLQAVRANLSPIFCLYPDGPDGPMHRQLTRLAEQLPPVIDAHTFGERDRLWLVTDPATIEALRAAMRPKPVIIADGHHRYEVALANRHLSPSVMAYFGWLEDPAMIVLPIHRLVQMGQSHALETMEERLRRCAQLTSVGEPETLRQLLEANRDTTGVFGFYARGQYRLLRLQSTEVERSLAQHGVPAAWSTLDVALLHYVLFPQLANGQSVAQWQVTYTNDARAAVQWARGGDDRVAFLLNPVPVQRIQEIALQGYRLPQKSTYFYPKLLSGLVINPFD